jgi:hypothetical protein
VCLAEPDADQIASKDALHVAQPNMIVHEGRRA